MFFGLKSEYKLITTVGGKKTDQQRRSNERITPGTWPVLGSHQKWIMLKLMDCLTSVVRPGNSVIDASPFDLAAHDLKL